MMMDPELRQQLEEAYPEWVDSVERLFEVHERSQQKFWEFLVLPIRAERSLPCFRANNDKERSEYAMDPEIQRQFEEFDERLKKAEERLLATGNLVRKAGIPMLVETHVTLEALKESDARLYGRMEQLTERMAELAEAQKRTEESLRRFIDRSGNGHGS